MSAAPVAVPARIPRAAAPTKSATVLKLLSRARGATAAELGEPTGWQPHSVRAYLSGLRKKGVTLVREARKTGETAYRIVDAVVITAVSNPAASSAPDENVDGAEVEAGGAAGRGSPAVVTDRGTVLPDAAHDRSAESAPAAVA